MKQFKNKVIAVFPPQRRSINVRYKQLSPFSTNFFLSFPTLIFVAKFRKIYFSEKWKFKRLNVMAASLPPVNGRFRSNTTLFKLPLPNMFFGHQVCFGANKIHPTNDLKAATSEAISIFWNSEFTDNYLKWYLFLKNWNIETISNKNWTLSPNSFASEFWNTTLFPFPQEKLG